MGMDSELKSRFLEDVEKWLDSIETPLPPVLPPEGGGGHVPSLFDLFGQMTALTQEIKLSNRTTSRLNTEITASLAKLSEVAANPAPAALAKARREGRLEIALELLDVRDRFERGIREAERRLMTRPSFFEWLARSRKVLEPAVSGNRLALERLDDMLRRLEILQIPAAEGDNFDPSLMKCVETEVREGISPHKVIEVIRAGFTHQGRVLRYAEVKVSKEKESQ